MLTQQAHGQSPAITAQRDQTSEPAAPTHRHPLRSVWNCRVRCGLRAAAARWLTLMPFLTNQCCQPDRKSERPLRVNDRG